MNIPQMFRGSYMLFSFTIKYFALKTLYKGRKIRVQAHTEVLQYLVNERKFTLNIIKLTYVAEVNKNVCNKKGRQY